MENEMLQPCTFCGSENVELCGGGGTPPYWWVECNCCGRESHGDFDKTIAIGRWNDGGCIDQDCS